jgi:hypothetical protein
MKPITDQDQIDCLRKVERVLCEMANQNNEHDALYVNFVTVLFQLEVLPVMVLPKRVIDNQIVKIIKIVD